MGIPNEVIIELTTECNLDCSFCYNKNFSPKNLGREEVKSILDNMHSWGVKAVRFTGGEPLLRNDIEELLSYAKSKGFYVILNTNGTLLNEKTETMNFVDLVLLSMHSSEQLRKIENTIELLGEKEFLLATLAIPDNIYNLECFYAFVDRIRKTHRNFSEWFLLRPISCNEKPALDISDLETLRNRLIEYNQSYSMDIKIANAIALCSVKCLSDVCKGGKFDLGHTRLFVKSDGTIYSDYLMQKRLGHISNDGLKDIWNSKALRNIRNYSNLPGYCKECYLLEKCKGGLNEDSSIINPDNIVPMLSIIVDSPDPENIVHKLSRQKCRKSAFEVIVVGKGIDFPGLRLSQADGVDDARAMARGQIVEFLTKSEISRDFVLEKLRSSGILKKHNL